MSEDSKNNFHEALLTACRAISWANGTHTESSDDCYTSLVRWLEVHGSVSKAVAKKWQQADDLDTLFTGSLEALMQENHENKLLSCAWMTKTAMISSTKGDSWVQVNGVEFWQEQTEFIDSQEEEFLEDAYRELGVSKEEAFSEMEKLPRIKKV